MTLRWNFEGIPVQLEKSISLTALTVETKAYTYSRIASTWDEVHDIVHAESVRILKLSMGSTLYHACLESYAATHKINFKRLMEAEGLVQKRQSMTPPKVVNHLNLHTQEQLGLNSFQKQTQRLHDPRLRS